MDGDVKPLTVSNLAAALPCKKKHSPGKSIHTEISPLRYAPVEMTNGRTTLPWRVIAK
jgi:hypothetical protein